MNEDKLIVGKESGQIYGEVDSTKQILKIQSINQIEAFGKLTRSKGFTFSQMGNVHEVISSLNTTQCGYLLVLITYIDYEGTLRNANKDKTPMTRKDIEVTLKANRKAVYRFMTVSVEEGILIEDNGLFKVNSRFHFKGNSKNKELVKVMSTTVRKLHKEHKITDIGHLYKIQAHVHITRNVLVKNPNEKNIDSLEYLNKEELASILEVSTDQLSKTLSRLKVDGQLCVGQIKIGRTVKFVVNPDIFNRTASTKDETLRTLFRAKK
ncbi:hypothetical protein QFZ28_003955 [Neobacillus niacini]|uniref:hypothetical protein n=1 Tax=Neobacillus niacini TaxID=86668 RepID=UPI0027867364|nr:hypothetical protein [Neobacillus niacini]MDQ1003555.1 hypothetical protein [Neobacillus niacini]